MATPVTVRVRYFNLVRELTGCSAEEVTLGPDAATIGGLLGTLARTHGPAFDRFLWSEVGTVNSHVRLFLNDRALVDLRLGEAFADGDELLIFSAVSGG